MGDHPDNPNYDTFSSHPEIPLDDQTRELQRESQQITWAVADALDDGIVAACRAKGVTPMQGAKYILDATHNCIYNPQNLDPESSTHDMVVSLARLGMIHVMLWREAEAKGLVPKRPKPPTQETSRAESSSDVRPDTPETPPRRGAEEDPPGEGAGPPA